MRMFKAAVFAASLMMSVAPAALAETPADVLVVAQNIDDIVSIDPAEAYEFSSGEYVTQTYDRLVQYDAPDVKKLAPGLASEWTVDDAAKTITFTLRDGVTFSSGNPLRGEDVVYSFKRVVVLNKAPAFILTQLGWTPENIDKMVTALAPAAPYVWDNQANVRSSDVNGVINQFNSVWDLTFTSLK